MREPRTYQNALLVGGPNHGELVEVEAGQQTLHFHSLALGAGVYCWDLNAPKPESELNIRAEQYRRMLPIHCPPKGTLVIFEHESLWDANVKRAAERLDREIETAARRSIELRERALAEEEALTDLYQRRDKLAAAYGV